MLKDDFLTVKDVAEMLDTEPYVLRFYEKELNLDIKRNTKGHRIYTMEDVELFKQVQEMREQGLQLKAIENIVHEGIDEETKETYSQLTSVQLTPVNSVKKTDTTMLEDVTGEQVKQFSLMMKDMFKEALIEYKELTQNEIHKEIEQKVENVVDEKLEALEARQKEKDAEYYKKLDETMREVQRMRKEMAENFTEQPKVKSSFWNRLFKEKAQSTQV
ncbi:helix-turn-helix domain-containing protein [Sporanaerobium hydrogeniformans]|uniref:helix-turn-helix domain-containing protein n=1 Tax=Sporanaerobium hydrogeniformans TaxID=3072179 RepID=UPI0015D50E97|nr:helix-turn-helix domain-containing protein [Sporanaerobium hydrogeniformans]